MNIVHHSRSALGIGYGHSPSTLQTCLLQRDLGIDAGTLQRNGIVVALVGTLYTAVVVQRTLLHPIFQIVLHDFSVDFIILQIDGSILGAMEQDAHLAATIGR